MINISTFTLTGTFAAHQHAVAERLDVAVTKPNGYVDIGLTADVFANEDLDNRYTRFLQEVHEPASAKDSDVGKRELEHRGPYPDKVVLAWALSNLLLCAVVLNTIPFPSSAVKKDLDGTYTTPKTDTRPATTTLLVIFGLVGSLEAVKFVGTLWFLIKEIAYSVL